MNKKVAIGIISAVVIAAVVLVVVIIKNNNSEDDITQTVSNGTNETTPTEAVTPDKKNDNTDTPITGTEKVPQDQNQTPTEIATPTPTPEAELKEYNVSVTLGEYKGIPMEDIKIQVTDEDIDREMERLRYLNADYIDIKDRALKEGDLAIADVKGYLDGNEVESESAVGLEIQLGNENYVEGYGNCIIGHKIGETVESDVTFPENYSADNSLSGKTLHFTFNIVTGFEYYVPELTDEYVKDVTGYKTVKEYREYVRNSLQEEADRKALEDAKRSVIQKIIDSSSFSGEIEEEIEYIYNSEIQQNDEEIYNDYYMDAATYYFYYYGVEKEDYYADIRSQAEYSVKYEHVLNEIAKQEGFTVSQDEFDSMLKEIFIDNYGFETADQVYSVVPKENVEKIVNGSVLREKAAELVFGS